MRVNTRKAFRQLLNGDEIIVATGADDTFAARIAEQAGIKVVFIGGSALNTVAGLPDGELTRSQYLARVKEITDVITIPALVDIECGFGAGTALDLMTTIQQCEEGGVAAAHCEDQQPDVKTNGWSGPYVVPRKVMLKKIEAALAAREDSDFVFIARTDSRERYGLEEALERGRDYARAGADMIMVQGLQSEDELKRTVDYIGAPLLVNNNSSGGPAGGFNPVSLPVQELQAIGVKLVTFGSGVLRAAGKAMQEFIEEIKRTGTDAGWVDRMMTKKEIFDIDRTDARDALRERFLDYK